MASTDPMAYDPWPLRRTLRVQGLRGLTNTGDVVLTPLTLLMGDHGSGKSTFGRALLQLGHALRRWPHPCTLPSEEWGAQGPEAAQIVVTEGASRLVAHVDHGRRITWQGLDVNIQRFLHSAFPLSVDLSRSAGASVGPPSSAARTQMRRWLQRHTDLRLVVYDSQDVFLQREDQKPAVLPIESMGSGIGRGLTLLSLLWRYAFDPSGLDVDRAQLLVLEHPETGLHPRWQARVAGALVEVAAYAPLLVETHSDAIVSTVGRHVKQGLIAAEDATMVFFEGGSVRQIPFMPDGSLGEGWPDAFFTW